MLFQTILANSPFRDLLTDRDLRYIDWSEDGPSPKVLTLDNAPALRATEALWARKFRADDPVLDYLDELRRGVSEAEQALAPSIGHLINYWLRLANAGTVLIGRKRETGRRGAKAFRGNFT